MPNNPFLELPCPGCKLPFDEHSAFVDTVVLCHNCNRTVELTLRVIGEKEVASWDRRMREVIRAAQESSARAPGPECNCPHGVAPGHYESCPRLLWIRRSRA